MVQEALYLILIDLPAVVALGITTVSVSVGFSCLYLFLCRFVLFCWFVLLSGTYCPALSAVQRSCCLSRNGIAFTAGHAVQAASLAVRNASVRGGGTTV